MFNRLQNILLELQKIDAEMRKPDSPYYCTVIERKVQDAAELLKEVLERVKG
jgi:hypothetical protein